MLRYVELTLLVIIASVLIPSAVYAQASITGVVKDTSGAVLPGVTVETASPALIEKTRSVVTDSTGQYRIENLRPGAYSVTFTLTGFNTVKRDGIELTGTFVASINAELRVGAVAETITVTGETPIVDVQSATGGRVINHEVIDAIPTGKGERNLAVLVPGVTLSGGQDVGGALTNIQGSLTVHGSHGTDQRIMQNGVSLGAIQGGANNSGVLSNMTAFQEVSIDSGAAGADVPTGGVRINFIPKDGGNTFASTFFTSFANQSMQSNNYTTDLKNAGLSTPQSIKQLFDINPGLGGPVMVDRLWFYATVRYYKTGNYPAGTAFNLNANKPTVWTYAADPGQQPSNDSVFKDGTGRLTMQATPKNKVGFSWSQQDTCYCLEAITSTLAPDAALKRHFSRMANRLADWSSPVSSRLLLEASGINRVEYVSRQLSPYTNPNMISVTDQALGNLVYRAPAGAIRNTTYLSYYVRGAASYITGAHAVKVGFTFGKASDPTDNFAATQPINFRFNNGVPNQITEFATPYGSEFDANDAGIFAQDKWTTKRLTLSYGVRYDYFKSSYPAVTLGPALLVPTRNISLAAADGADWKDISPRTGLSYDLRGDGKTALKASLSRYVQGQGDGDVFGLALAPVNLIAQSTARSWTDTNKNFVPDCDLTNPAAQTVVGGDVCGAFTNQSFGKSVPGSTYDPDPRSGWGKRGYSWSFSGGVQHEILPRTSIDVNYFRRWYGNFIVTDNRATVASDYTSFNLPVPSTDPRLPNAGGVVTGLFDVNPGKFGQTDNYITFASNYGKQIEHWNGFDITINSRPKAGVLVQGGLSTGRTVTDNCEVAAKVPESLLTGTTWTALQNCHQETAWLSQIKLQGSYTVPRVDVQISGALQNLPGPAILANYAAPNAVVVPSLGRSLSGSAANITVGLVNPAVLYGARMNQLDLRLSKILKFGRSRTSLNFDLYNAFNGNMVLSQNNVFGGATPWQAPQSILTARFAKVGMQFDF